MFDSLYTPQSALLWTEIRACFILFFVIGLCPGPSFASLFITSPKDRWAGFKLTVAGFSFVLAMAYASLIFSRFSNIVTYYIYISCCLISLFVLTQMIYYGYRTVFREIKLESQGRSSFEEIKIKQKEDTVKGINEPGPWYFGFLTSWFNGFYYSVVFPQMIMWGIGDFRVALEKGHNFLSPFPTVLQYVIFGLMISIAMYIPFCVLFTIYGLIINRSADFFGSRFVLITNALNIFFLTFLLIDTLIKIILGPVIYISHGVLFCKYAMENGYLFHNILGLDQVF